MVGDGGGEERKMCPNLDLGQEGDWDKN